MNKIDIYRIPIFVFAYMIFSSIVIFIINHTFKYPLDLVFSVIAICLLTLLLRLIFDIYSGKVFDSVSDIEMKRFGKMKINMNVQTSEKK